MKNIDVKSLLIGTLLTSTILLGIGASKESAIPKYQITSAAVGSKYPSWVVVTRMDNSTGKLEHLHFHYENTPTKNGLPPQFD